MRVGAKKPSSPSAPIAPASAFKRSKLADRGKVAEDKVKAYLDDWAARSEHRDFERLLDTKAARMIVRAAAADFEAYSISRGGDRMAALIEVKETQHEYRLDRARLTQAPRLRKRAKAGVRVFVLVYHSTLDKWRCLTPATWGPPGDKGSWDLRDLPLSDGPGEALFVASQAWDL